jgi:hypothetical protein
MKKHLFSLVGAFVLISMSLFICACGDGASGDGSSSSQVVAISGVAASGAPIFGTVYAKGANGGTASKKINADGSYYLDVTHLVPPYILYAEGTVNWERIKIYTCALNGGNINITPITDYILRTSLSGDAESAFTNWNSASVTSDVLTAAETDVQQQLQPLLNAAGIPDDIDLCSVTFSANHKGLDLVLDSITIRLDITGTIATVTNNLTGSSYTNDLTTDSDDAATGLPSSDESKSLIAFNDALAINQVWQILVDLYADSEATAGDLNTTWAPYVADDFLNRGRNKSEELDAWVSGDVGPCAGFIVYVTIKRVLLPSDLEGDINTYEKGYLLNLYYSNGCSDYNINTRMVYNGTKWLFFGDRIWLGDFGPKDRAKLNVSASGAQEFFSGLGFSAIDSNSNYAYSQGIRSAIITGPGLPEEGVILEHSYPKQIFNIYPGQESPCGYFGDEWCLTDSIIATIPYNANYVTCLFTEEASTLAADDDPTNNFSSIKYSSTLNHKPYLSYEMDASLFPVLIEPTPPELSNINIPGEQIVSWINPEGSFVKNVKLQWVDDYSSIFELEFSTEDCETTDSTTFDSTGLNHAHDWANIHMTTIDNFGRSLGVSWHFEE